YAKRAPQAAAYVAAVRMSRFGGRPVAPSSEQRAALRSELAVGLGWGGRLRAWWALPPGRRRPGAVYTSR
ncbi:MAG: transglutaminase domain protein, partial [Solirubrobacteraceae bacterium]|nr:transglutaminase domain protein [Solirubrobacteraceae bacterium]